MAATIKNLLDKGIASVTVKSSSFLETSKLSNQITIAEGEIAAQRERLATAVYEAWRAEGSLSEAAIPHCTAIAEQEWQIAELRRKIEGVREEGQRVLGEAPTTDKHFCTACGGENVATAKFCCKCGGKID